MVGSIIIATKRVIAILTLTTEVLGQIAQVIYLCKKKTKTSKSLVYTDSCPIKAIPSKNSNKPVDPPENIGVMAIVAIMEPATTHIPLRSLPSNKIQVLLDMGSNGDLFFHKKGKPKPLPT